MRRLYTGLAPPSDPSITHCPFIQIKPRPPSDPQVVKMLNSLSSATHLIFTSKSAVEIFFRYCKIKEGLNAIAVGKVTASYLKKEGIENIIIPKEETAEGIVALIDTLTLNSPFFIWPHSALSRRIIPDFLTRSNLDFCECVLYETIFIAPNPLPDLSKFDEIIFTSPSTVLSFIKAYKKLPSNITLTPIGPVTRSILAANL